MTCSERNESLKNTPTRSSRPGPDSLRLILPMLITAAALAAGCRESRMIGGDDAGTRADAMLSRGSDAAPTATDAGSEPDAGRARARDSGAARGADSGPALPSDAGPAVTCRTDADCEAAGGGVCDEGICVHIAECPAMVERARCAERSTSARWCIGGRNKMAKLSRLLCTEEAVTARVYDVGSACRAGTCEAGRVCETALTGTGRAFCASPCSTDDECGSEDVCLRFSTASYCGRPIGGVADVFCSTTNVDATFGPAFAAPRFFDASGAPIEIRGDLQEVLDLDPALGCP